MIVKRIVANIAAASPEDAGRFYSSIFGLDIVMDHGWIKTFSVRCLVYRRSIIVLWAAGFVICRMENSRIRDILSAASKPGECIAGWVAHYAIGIAFAGVLILIASPGWIQQPTLVPALLVGLATIAIPFLVMQPALGLGIAAAKTPNRRRARILSLAAHTSFGLGLYLAALAFSPVLGS